MVMDYMPGEFVLSPPPAAWQSEKGVGKSVGWFGGGGGMDVHGRGDPTGSVVCVK
jgi:hypothetical protein